MPQAFRLFIKPGISTSLVQDRRNLGQEVFNELGFGINRTAASTSVVDTHPGLSISLVPGRPFGTIDIAGMSLVGSSAVTPLGDFSTVYQVHDQLSLTKGAPHFEVRGPVSKDSIQWSIGFWGEWNLHVPRS